MPQDDLMYIGHMLDMARQAVDTVEGKTRQGFDSDHNLRLALAHLLQVIGEAARRVSQEFKNAHPNIAWKAIVGMRHKVVHDYMGVDEDIVWNTATQELQPLINQLETLISSESEET